MGVNELLTVKEAAALLKTSKVQVRKMIQSGDLLAVKVGREYRILTASIKEYIESNCISFSAGCACLLRNPYRLICRCGFHLFVYQDSASSGQI